jgi:putative redox protein
VKARIKWIEGVAFLGETESGHAFVMDGSPEAGGRNLGPRPMETVLAGTGACSAFDVVHILKKGRHAITDCVVDLDAERAPQDPKVFTRIHMHFIVTGKNLPREQVERAVHLSAEKYCSASIMLAKTAAITHDFEIIEE